MLSRQFLTSRLTAAAVGRLRPSLALPSVPSKRWMSDEHKEETYEEYTERYLHFFNKEADDLFELSRGLNNAFSADVIPPTEVLVAAMQAARRLNSFPLAARTVEALREKLQGDTKTYEIYLSELKPTMDELGVPEPKELGR